MDKRDLIVKITNMLTFELHVHDPRVNVQDYNIEISKCYTYRYVDA